MKRNLLTTLFLSGASFILLQHTASAQLSVTGQLRTRTELRDGQGSLPAEDAKASVFTNQRTRLNLGYNTSRYRFLVSVQDVRVWGADQSTISNLEGSKLFMHQAWGEMILSDSTTINVDNLSVKAGRQEIVYDDARLLGNLDWLQQARRHDAIVLKFSNKGWAADAGFAFNQNHGKDTPGKNGNVYNGTPPAPVVPGTNGIGMMYKSMQYLYLARTTKFGKVNALLFKDDFQKTQTIAGVTTPAEGVNSRITVGGALFATITDALKLNAAAYYQGNNDRFGNTLDAYNLTADAAYSYNKLTINPGFDFLSGNNTTKQGTVNHRFDPLYGTPHKFWGYMDYFYVADPFGVDGNAGRSPGLVDYFIRNRYKASDKLQFTLDLHEFYAANKIADSELSPTGKAATTRRLGTELDVVANYSIFKNVAIEAGYATLFATDNLNLLKAPATTKQERGQWAYLMLNFTPDFLAR
ncbi:alginate export family protein [Pontibacter fetidus]|uniref:Alginate export family protein n=1 Tax=Pontibacter fetidus TaxID=2700082 RepID=A0A6B2H8X7_9BACT|nr:alginate export family protein [Pontibacter fetidus]NDK55664.1 alginate export family protein [Pontibacter fetidus]